MQRTSITASRRGTAGRTLLGATSLLAFAPSVLVGAAISASAGAADAAASNGSLFRYPDISRDSVVFVYANDLWIAPKQGGMARPLASPPGGESMPRFSADGSSVAFIGNYGGGRDLYVIGSEGGVPSRVTHHPGAEVLNDWTADGRLIFASGDLGGLTRAAQLFTVPSNGGLPTQLPVPYGANGAISSDGTWLAYTPHSIDTRTWKRYRGGMQTDIWLYNLTSGESKRITDWEGQDSIPMWRGDKVYYLSDAGDEHRLNIWRYDTKSGKRDQLTRFKDFDVKWPAIGPESGSGEIVFQYGAKIWRLDLGDHTTAEIPITIPGDRPKLMPQTVDAAEFITGSSISPSGKRVAVEARGDIWSAPAENGTPRNLTRSSGIHETDPAWSPDGKSIAYFADGTGEYELYVMQADGKGEPKRVTTDGNCYRTGITWAPDSKKMVIGDKTGAIYLVEIEGGKVTLIDRNPWEITMGPVSWSHDSRWLAFAHGPESNRAGTVYIYDTKSGEKKQVTSGMFDDSRPTFDRNGDWLVFVSKRAFNPQYSALDTTWIYNDADILIGVPLRADMKMAWLPTSDEEDGKSAEKKDEKDEKKDEAKPGDQPKPAEGDAPPRRGPGRRRGGELDANVVGGAIEQVQEGEKKEAPAKADGPAGTWKCTTDLPGMGRIEFTLVLNLEEGNRVKGNLSSSTISGPVEGSWTPETKRLELTLKMPEGVHATMTLTVDGDKISGEGTGPAGEVAKIEGTREATATGGDDATKKEKEKSKEVKIDFDGFELRAIQLPAANGSYGTLGFNDRNHVLYSRAGTIYSMDLGDKKREESKVTAGGFFEMSADGKKLLLGGRGASIAGASAGATPKPIVTSPMLVEVDPRAEWKQMFREAWRLQRDYFYDPHMHGVDWKGAYDHYSPLVDQLAAREDLSYLISELISELNVGHAYYQGGDVESSPNRNVGLLGVDWKLDGDDSNKAYRITKVYRGGAWDLDARGPLSEQGLGIEEGDYVLAVNGVKIDTARDPWAAFQGLAGKAVTLTVSKSPVIDDKAKDVVVTTTANEGTLRYRAWIERKRAYVAEKSGGKIGYIYVPNTGVDGQTDLVRQFQGQADLAALIIDDRWNGGGQIPNRFIEMLNRPVTNYWARRDTKDWVWPPDSHQGPKAMLINGLAGSGGDMFPWLFKHQGLGKLIGTRTWGGLVGISGNPGLIDGGRVTVPTFGFYETDGTWGIEGHGVDPDIEVLDDPALMKNDGDPQLDKAIEHLLEELKTKSFVPVPKPKYPNRSGMGILPEDK
ncbi:MAG: PD40 domain-containing protein [Phycisphaerae bacterium]|nr:PD40 domain-containing protein [Phycisphaerae bacterium]